MMENNSRNEAIGFEDHLNKLSALIHNNAATLNVELTNVLQQINAKMLFQHRQSIVDSLTLSSAVGVVSELLPKEQLDATLALMFKGVAADR
jgi:hypothetical protein